MRLFFVIALFVLSLGLFAQTKVIHNNVACYEHVVEQGNTLYGISKQYAVSIPALLDFNPEVRLGLNVGQKVFIPIKEVNQREAKRSPDLEGGTIVHTVQKKETLYSLSKKYNVAINAILEANPGLESQGLKKGVEIRIPSHEAAVDASFVKPAEKDSLLHHEVILGETLYGIAQQYEVHIDSIKKVNGGLFEGLRAGMTLRIPRFVDGFVSAGPDRAGKEIELNEIKGGKRQTLDIALLLPFSLSGLDTVGLVPRKSEDVMKLTDIAYEYYRGARIAFDELSYFGLDANVHVVDVTGKSQSLTKAMKSLNPKSLDLVIGPLHKESFQVMVKESKMDSIFKVSPLSGSLDVSSADFHKSSTVKPSDEAFIQKLVNYVGSHEKGKNVLLLSGEIKSMHKEFMRSWSTDSLRFGLKELKWDKRARNTLLAALEKGKENVIVFPVKHRPTITAFMSELATTDFRELDITVYGMENWVRFDNLDLTVLERLRLKVPVAHYVDWESEGVIDFCQSYYREFDTSPSARGYALLAYDLVYYYVENLMRFGPAFLEAQHKVGHTGLCTGFQMAKTGQGGWMNEYTQLLEFTGEGFMRLD